MFKRALCNRRLRGRALVIFSICVIGVFIIAITLSYIEYIDKPWRDHEDMRRSKYYFEEKAENGFEMKKQKLANQLNIKTKQKSATRINNHSHLQKIQIFEHKKPVEKSGTSSRNSSELTNKILLKVDFLPKLKADQISSNKIKSKMKYNENTVKYSKKVSLPLKYSNVTAKTQKMPELPSEKAPGDTGSIEKWERHLSLTESNKVLIKWNFTEEDITMLVIGETRGYVGIGFAHSEGMAGADLVVGWVKDGKTFIKDLHAFHNGRPSEDDQQDYNLLYGGENDTHTWFCFTRKLNTCDEQDMEITWSTFHILWGLHQDDPEYESAKYFQYHSLNKGIQKNFLLNVVPEKPEMTSDIAFTDLLAPNVPVKLGALTHYWWCYLMKVPTFETKHHMIGYEAIVQKGNEEVVHHIALNLCKNSYLPLDIELKGGHGCYLTSNFNRLQADLRCITTTILIARGGPQETFYPHQVGIPFGSTKDEPMYVMLQIHYNLLAINSDITDKSGLRVYHTPNLRPFSGGIMYLTKVLYQMIPPRVLDFPNVAICSGKCTQKFSPSKGAHIFGLLLHAHKIATKITVYHFRNGKEIRRIADDYFDYEFHYLRFLKEEMVVLPNDTLAIECLYDSRERDVSTGLGLGTNDEMCLAYVLAYPPFDILFCGSYMLPKEIHASLKEVPDLALNETPFSFYQHILYLAAIQMYTYSHNWTDTELRDFRHAMRSGEHFSICHFSDLIGIVHENTRLPPTKTLNSLDVCPSKP